MHFATLFNPARCTKKSHFTYHAGRELNTQLLTTFVRARIVFAPLYASPFTLVRHIRY